MDYTALYRDCHIEAEALCTPNLPKSGPCCYDLGSGYENFEKPHWEQAIRDLPYSAMFYSNPEKPLNPT